jgi:hypothetical protein
VPPTTARRDVRTRAELEDWMLPLPKRGLFWSAWGLGGNTAVIIDRDTRKLTTRVQLIGESSVVPVAKTLAASDVDRLWRMTETTWGSAPPAFEHVTDYREVVVALDGDQVMIISVPGPMDVREPAAALAIALRKSAGRDW